MSWKHSTKLLLKDSIHVQKDYQNTNLVLYYANIIYFAFSGNDDELEDYIKIMLVKSNINYLKIESHFIMIINL